MARERNPVALMDSVEVMDLLKFAYTRLYYFGEDLSKLARIKEQERRHRYALRNHIDGSFAREDEPDPPETKIVDTEKTRHSMRSGGNKK